MAERELRVLSRHCGDHRIGTLAELEPEVAVWQTGRHVHAVSISWRFTTADARIMLTRLSPSIPD
jgi:hypothetical protein